MIEIELPFPSGVHSHNKGHWSAKTGPVKAMREHACVLGRQAVAEHGRLLGPVRMSYQIFVPDNRRRDVVNMLQQCKPFLDGIVDSGLIEGDHWQICSVGSVVVYRSKGKSMVVLRFEKIS